MFEEEDLWYSAARVGYSKGVCVCACVRVITFWHHSGVSCHFWNFTLCICLQYCVGEHRMHECVSVYSTCVSSEGGAVPKSVG